MIVTYARFKNRRGNTHRRITPEWPRAKGECERFMRNLNKVIQAAHIEGQRWQQEVLDFVKNYRASLHSATGIPPPLLRSKWVETLEQSY